MTSPHLTQANIDKVAELFPQVITESLDADGNPVRAVDFDLLRQELSDHIVEGPQERYRLDWPGKRVAAFAANAPIAKTLRPVREESVGFDTTRNIFIEGDNLDALKLLQESYLGKVKLIYIDPPYNTGRDFVYNDSFATSNTDYLLKSGQADESGSGLVSNPESGGRFHSSWLSMMYPRLRLARNLMAEDGVIFISLDDGEVANLRRICDEIFGQDQFLGLVIWKKKNTPPNDRILGAQHDYLLVYSRSGSDGLRLRPRSTDQINRYKNPDNHPKGPWLAGDLTANVKGGRYVASLHYPIINPRNGMEHWPANNGNWRFNSTRMAELIRTDSIYFGKDDKSAPKLKRFLMDVKDGTPWTTLWDFAPLNAAGSAEMAEIFGNGTIFESPKPTGLLKLVLEAATDRDSLVLDFFAGSSSLAAATLQKNAEDGGSRRFIMVQLDEATGDSVAAEAGFKTIAELSRERIRREGQKLNGVGDVGFRAFRVDSTNMVDIFRTPGDTDQHVLTTLEDSVKKDRTGEDLLFQVLLDWGLDLTLPIKRMQTEELEVFVVDDGALVACFEDQITLTLVRTLAGLEPLRAVFRDSGFASDAERISAEQIFKELSPATDVKAI